MKNGSLLSLVDNLYAYSPSLSRKRVKFCIVLLLFIGQCIITSDIFSATIISTGSGNWTSTTPNAPWPLGIVPSSTDDIIIGNGVTLTVNSNATCKSLSFNIVSAGIATGTLHVNPGYLLTIVNDLSCPAPGLAVKSNGNYTITGGGSIAAGSFTCNNGQLPVGSSVSMVTVVSSIQSLTVEGDVNIKTTYSSSGNKLNNSTLNIQSGTVTVKGSIVTVNGGASNEATIDLVSAASSPSLIMAGNVPYRLSAIGINTMNFGGEGATVHYSSAQDQVIPAFSYKNLSISGAGIKTLADGASSVTGNLSTSGTITVVPANSLTIGGSMTIGTATTFSAGTFIHNIGGNWTNNGTFIAGASTINLNGAAVQTVGGTSSSTFNHLMLTNPTGEMLASPVRIGSFLSFGNVNNSVLTTNGLLTLGSDAVGTAMLKDITNGGANTGNSINGHVTVERYVQGKRSYRFLSAPINSTTSIRANWMENTNNTSAGVNNNLVPGYGTHITGSGGSGNGFDATNTNNPSLFTFNHGSQAWVPIANTNGLLSAGTAYRIMVRGNRSADLNDNNAVPSVTTLRATGTLVTGTVMMAKSGGGGTAGMPILTSVQNAYSFIANPYASSVNWLLLDKADVANTMYVYDPTVAGSNGRGAYIAYNGTLHSNSNLHSSINNHLQSGQAFFIETTGISPSITFRETYKSSTSSHVFREAASDLPNVSVQLLLPSQTGAGTVADGARIYYSKNFSQSIGDEDSYKFTNPDENIAVVRNEKSLSLEGRSFIGDADTLQLKVWQLTQKQYTMKFTLENFTGKPAVYLEDSYVRSVTPLKATGETEVAFSITSDAASTASNRFRILLKTTSTLPVKLSSIQAYPKNKGIQVEWLAEFENDLNVYEIERSADGQHFETIGNQKPKNNLGTRARYAYFDPNLAQAYHFYRIKSVEKSGEVSWSEVVRVLHANENNGIRVSNNAVAGNTIRLCFDNVKPGNYKADLLNASGQRLYSGTISYTGGTVYDVIHIGRRLPPGLYHLQLVSGTFWKTIQLLMQ